MKTHTFTIVGRPMSTTNSQQIISIPIKGSSGALVPALKCPECAHVVLPEHIGPRPTRPAVLRSSAALKWMKSAVSQLKKQQRVPLIEGPVDIFLEVYRERNIGDVDNYIKGCLDAIAEAGILRDDKQVITVGATKHTDKSNPRYVVRITELDTQASLFDAEAEEEEEPTEEVETLGEFNPDDYVDRRAMLAAYLEHVEKGGKPWS